uniref:Microtubule-associated protein n=1 Tax=Mesocestoides corti TaxID=53468 RepID=A0A5K3F752_MESCO
MEPSSDTSNVTSHMAQLSLQTNGSAAAASRPRTGIPRYAIPYRRPGRPSANNGGGGGGDGHYSVSPSISEGASSTQQTPTTPITVSPRGRNGVRAESFGDESLPGYYGAGGGGNGAGYRYGRAASVDPLRGDSESEHSSAFSSSGQPRRITSKIGSLANANYKPGGGNVKILSTKADYSHAQSKCNSKANLKYKPGGGDVQIVDNKLTFKEEGKSRVNSFANAKHVPGGGNVKIFDEKLPWLKYNKPNLPPEERAKINKQSTVSPNATNEPIYTSRHSSTTS